MNNALLNLFEGNPQVLQLLEANPQAADMLINALLQMPMGEPGMQQGMQPGMVNPGFEVSPPPPGMGPARPPAPFTGGPSTTSPLQPAYVPHGGRTPSRVGPVGTPDLPYHPGVPAVSTPPRAPKRAAPKRKAAPKRSAPKRAAPKRSKGGILAKWRKSDINTLDSMFSID